MRRFTLALLLLLFSVIPAHADSLPFVLNMLGTTCTQCLSHVSDINLHAEFTVVETFGQVWDGYYGFYYTAPYLKVVGIEGTLNGLYFDTLLNNTPNHESWMWDDFYHQPSNVGFIAGGIRYQLFFDRAWNMIYGLDYSPDFGTVVAPLSWSTTTEPLSHVSNALSIESVPEPSTLALLGIGLLGIPLMKKMKKIKARPLS